MDFCLKCGKCCTHTEMQLSENDIRRIEGIDTFHWKRNQFCEQIDGFPTLKNQNGNCIFFNPSNNNCSIYYNRPTGCRFYPLIYDEAKDHCILDTECPHRTQFYRHKPEQKQVCQNLKYWIKNELYQTEG
jgi:Fe-S-cluster containining protein